MRLEMNMKDHGEIYVEEEVIVQNGHITVQYNDKKVNSVNKKRCRNVKKISSNHR